MTNEQLGDDAMLLANHLHRICDGHPTASVIMALAMMLGWNEAQAKRPDPDTLMRLVREEVDRQLAIAAGAAA